MDDESLLSIGHMTYWLHTANAATVSEQSSRTCRNGSLRPSRSPFSGLVHLGDELLTEQRGAAVDPSLNRSTCLNVVAADVTFRYFFWRKVTTL